MLKASKAKVISLYNPNQFHIDLLQEEKTESAKPEPYYIHKQDDEINIIA